MNRGIPKSARDLLASQGSGTEHPSADLLNGYVEQSLSAAEKAGLVQHLAACEDCREVVFLASTAGEEQTAASIAEPGRVWRGWKWAVPAVAVLALVSSILVEHRQAPAPRRPAEIQSTQSKNDTLPSPRATTPDLARNESPASHVTARSTFEAKPDSRERLRTTTTSGEKISSRDQIASVAGASAGTSNQDREALALLSKPAPITPAPPAAMTHNAEAVSSAAAPAVSPLQTAVSQQPPAGHTFGALGGTRFQSMNKAAAPMGISSASHVSIGPPSQWRISADGHLERSQIPDTWTRALGDQPVVFRAVAVVVNDVWAGGNEGVLFHSLDGGHNWSRVMLTADGHSETGAVISLHFDDVWHGSVVTESGSTWTTSDRGQTWVKQ